MAKTLIGAAVAAVLTVVLLTALDVLSLAERMAIALVVFCAILATSVVTRLVDQESRDDTPAGTPSTPNPLHDTRLHEIRSQVSEIRQEVSEHARRRTLHQYMPRLLADAARLQAEVDSLDARRTGGSSTGAGEADTVYDAQLRLLREELKALHAEIAGHSSVREGSTP